MSHAQHCLHAFGHALAAHALYGTGHRARTDAGARLLSALERLFAADLRPSFTFLDNAVLYQATPVHGLKEWTWGQRLGAVGIRRLEFTQEVTRSALEEFLAALHHRLGREGRGSELPELRGIEAGDVAVGTMFLAPAQPTSLVEAYTVSLGEEVEAVRYAYDRVAQGSELPLDELDAVVRALTVALHGEGELLVPLLALRALDDHAALHAVNTAVLTMTFCEWLGLTGGDIRAVGKAALLHDIGMARVPKDIFTKKRLNTAGRAGLAHHPEAGARLLLARSTKLDLAATTAYEHHLRMDGQGYPSRHFHRDLHYISRIIAVCGTYDALRSVRSYRPARDPQAALREIESGIGTIFDPGIAQAFVQMMRRWEHRVVAARTK